MAVGASACPPRRTWWLARDAGPAPVACMRPAGTPDGLPSLGSSGSRSGPRRGRSSSPSWPSSPSPQLTAVRSEHETTSRGRRRRRRGRLFLSSSRKTSRRDRRPRRGVTSPHRPTLGLRGATPADPTSPDPPPGPRESRPRGVTSLARLRCRPDSRCDCSRRRLRRLRGLPRGASFPQLVLAAWESRAGYPLDGWRIVRDLACAGPLRAGRFGAPRPRPAGQRIRVIAAASRVVVRRRRDGGDARAHGWFLILSANSLRDRFFARPLVGDHRPGDGNRSGHDLAVPDVGPFASRCSTASRP